MASTFDRANLINRLQSIVKRSFEYTCRQHQILFDIQHKIDETKKNLKVKFEALKKEIDDKKKTSDSQIVDYHRLLVKQNKN